MVVYVGDMPIVLVYINIFGANGLVTEAVVNKRKTKELRRVWSEGKYPCTFRRFKWYYKMMARKGVLMRLTQI